MYWTQEQVAEIHKERHGPQFTTWENLAERWTRKLGQPISGEQIRSAHKRGIRHANFKPERNEAQLIAYKEQYAYDPDVMRQAAIEVAKKAKARDNFKVINAYEPEPEVDDIDDDYFAAKPIKEFRQDTIYLHEHFDPNGTLKFGALGDTHLCSKYERLDLLEEVYAIYKDNGIKTVFHTGNYVEGEASFNVNDIHTAGMDNQLKYFVNQYPQVPGINTLIIGGDDHEGLTH